MGFWARLLGKTEMDTTVTDYQRSVGSAQTTPPPSVLPPSGPFRMDIEDVFSITGRGTVATGRVASGTVSEGDALTVVRANGQRLPVAVTGIEAFRKRLSSAGPGDNIGLLINGATRSDIARGDRFEG